MLKSMPQPYVWQKVPFSLRASQSSSLKVVVVVVVLIVVVTFCKNLQFHLTCTLKYRGRNYMKLKNL